MISFASDYIAGAHPQVLQKLFETNLENLPGYGSDKYCQQAAEKIKVACECPDAQIFFLTGGTQTNQIVISSVLQNYQGVIAATTGHVSIHEAGAIEYTGHKVLTLPEKDGKLYAEAVKSYLENFYADGNCEHMVQPGMVYISFPTEYGSLYSKKELADLYEVCKEYKIPLYIDGARLGYALSSDECDVKLCDLKDLCDIFYIGGTKVGAFCGEAVVFTHKNAPLHFMTQIKQHGALLAKGWLVGAQFDALFTDDLYFKISRHAIKMAALLKELFSQKGFTFFRQSPTNQIFIILENQKMQEMQKSVNFSFWEKFDENHTVVRFATSWSTKEADIEELKRILG